MRMADALQSEMPSDPGRLRQANLWLVDDSSLALESVTALLGAEYAVETFAEGSTLLERATRDPLPDLLLLDWVMPGVSGSDVLRFLRSSARTESLPILVLTAAGSSTDLVEALDGGANDYVSKPCSKAELAARVSALVRSSELRRRAEEAERENRMLLRRERAARAEAEMANFVKDDFLATLSHELRTPLHSILGWVALLRGGTLAPETAVRALATIERSGKAQATMIEDLLDISRIVTGKMRLDMALVDPCDAAEQAVETVRPVAATKKVELVTRIERVGLVRADAARLQQVAWNLLTNAVRYTPQGGTVTMEIGAARDGVLVAVTDTGDGIDPQLLVRIFDRFKQGDSTTTRTHGGLGIGLAIVRHITELHGGTVKVSSEGRGRGARFEVWLPLAAQAHTEVKPTPPSTIASLEGIRVLVVDDDPDSLEVASTALRSAGATVSSVSSAHEALRALDEALPHLVVTDIMMPDMDGNALLRAVRERPAARGGALPVLALTAAASASDRERIVAHGFDWHLAKPIDLGVLVGTVGRVVRTRAT
jgi:signal transduction histidine kinase